jgi:uncharacterized membrane protein
LAISTGIFDPLYAAFSGGLSAFLFTLSISLSVLTTFILMGLSGSFPALLTSGENQSESHSAGRIWWLASGARVLIGQKVVDKYITISAMMLP